MTNPTKPTKNGLISVQFAFLLVSFSLGQLGDGLNIFQGVYLNGIGWNPGAVGTALSLMGFTSLIMQPFAGDWVDKTTMDRRLFLVIASIATALSASTILFVKPDHLNFHLMYASKVVEGLASSFIAPCLAALTLASFGPKDFDTVMASNILWGHVGSVAAAVLAGLVAYMAYPHIDYCFLVIGASALVAILFVPSLPQGDPRWGRGLASSNAASELASSEQSNDVVNESTPLVTSEKPTTEEPVEVASYMEVFLDYKTCVLSGTGFFFHFANANVLLVLGEMMGQSESNTDENGRLTRLAIPLTAGAIITAQFMMTIATWFGGAATDHGVGRKPLFMGCLLSLPIRCALIVMLKDAGHFWLLSTQIFDGIGGGLFGLIVPYIVADITFGTGRFNAVMGLTAAAFGCGATLSNYLGQMVVQNFGHTTSLWASFFISIIPVVLFWTYMPETFGKRGAGTTASNGTPVEV